ncbi:pupal cuticle protein [Phlebotomus argentipes]|uniref:pupal cuticle protein n=1 Tax=Phlebotomus argentipes TaxID=94469 RepID=UPI002892F49A|nr:pupal cuticle protein [Phlebotomus argentipes]
MKAFIVAALFVVACTATPYAGLSSQYHTQDGHGNYAYGYADPNSQKHEESSHGFTRGAYSYVDGHGILQSVHYTADPHHGFQVAATNLPKGPAPALYHAPAHHVYAGPWVHAGLGYQGGPLETPEVAHAKAAHFAAHAAARSGLHHLYKRSAHWGGYHVPVIHNGVPVETPEVQAAKAEHAAAHAKVGGHYAYAPVHHGGYAPLAPNGVVLDTPEIAAAKAAHFAAHAAAGGHAYAPAHYAASHHHAGPVDTPEVQHAKALHFAAVAEAQSKSGYSHDDGHYDGHYDGRWDDGHYDGRWDGHHGAWTHAAAAHHVPVIHNGVPVETPEVQHAKAAHYAAHAEASARAYHH